MPNNKAFQNSIVKIRAIFNRYINGTKGAISLFLALIMTPLLSIALLLVESSRYQSAVQLMEEMMDLCSFSAVSLYDVYLEERFGLLAVDQEINIASTFEAEMKANEAALGKGVSILSTNAKGSFALSNERILKQQILEYGEISVITKIVVEGLDLGSLFDKLIEAIGLEALQKKLDFMKSTYEATESVVKLLKACLSLKDASDKYSNAYQAYKNEYYNFNSEVVAYAEALETAISELEEDETTEDIYDDSDVKSAKSDAKSAAQDYKDEADALIKALEELKKVVDNFRGSLADIVGAKTELGMKLGEANGDKTYADSTSDWVLTIISQIIDELESILLEDFDDKLYADIQELKSQKEKLTTFKNSGIDSVDSTWTSTTVYNKYGPVTVDAVPANLSTLVKNAIDRLDDEAKADTSSLDTFTDLVGKIFDIKVFYNNALNANVASDCLYRSVDMNFSDETLIASMNQLVKSSEALSEALNSDEVWGKIVKVAESVGRILLSLIEFVAAVVAWAVEVVASLVIMAAEIIMPDASLYDKLILFGYGAYNMPNRVNCTTEKTMSGYNYQTVFQMNGGSLSAYNRFSFGGKLGENLSSRGGSDPAFKGAVQEYLMVGSTSEFENQLNAFTKLYLFRLLLNLAQVLTNPEVASVAAMMGPAGVAAPFLLAIVEPFLDTLFLVNGTKEPLIKRSLYLTPSGIDDLCSKLVEITVDDALEDLMKNEVKQTFSKDKGKGSSTSSGTGSGNSSSGTGSGNSNGSNANGKKEEEAKGLFSCNYTTHLLFLTLLQTSETEFTQRLQNVVQMEAAQNYKDKEYKFKLNKAYTGIRAETNYRLNPMLGFDGLTSNGLFDAKAKCITGY